MSRPIKGGSTDQSTTIRILDSTTGLPETGVTSATSGLSINYRREGGSVASISISDLAAVNSAHSDGGIKHVGSGYYRLDLPDAAVAGSNTGVIIEGTATDMVIVGAYHPLVAYDPQDTVRLGLTALPNAAADAAGGLVVSDAGGLDADTLASNVAAILADTGTDGVAVSAAAIAAIVDAVWDEATIGHSTSGSFGKLLIDNLGDIPKIDGTINDAAATTTSFVVASSLSSSNDFYNGSVIAFTDGALVGIARRITDYVGSSRTATVSPALPSAPANGAAFIIIGRID